MAGIERQGPAEERYPALIAGGIARLTRVDAGITGGRSAHRRCHDAWPGFAAAKPMRTRAGTWTGARPLRFQAGRIAR
jgi:hypothetical protein